MPQSIYAGVVTNILVNVYMSVCSSENLHEFSLYLGKQVSFLSDKYIYVCFLGDFNAKYTTETIFNRELKAVIAKNDLVCSDEVTLHSFIYLSPSGRTSWIDHVVGSGSFSSSVMPISIRY